MIFESFEPVTDCNLSVLSILYSIGIYIIYWAQSVTFQFRTTFGHSPRIPETSILTWVVFFLQLGSLDVSFWFLI